MDSLILLSGGLDSTACLYFYLSMGFQVDTLFIDYGQPAQKAERISAKAIAEFYKAPLTLLKFKGPKRRLNGEILGRNALLATAALVYKPGLQGIISFGIHAGTTYYDCHANFIGLLSQMIDGYSNGRISLGVPFLTWSKGMIWDYCQQNNLPTHLTWSCEKNSDQSCGSCLSCRDLQALNAGSKK